MELTRVAVYQRRVAASLARVWENVLDWEHLPWLHRSTFGHVRLLAERSDGWRAEASLSGGPPFVIDVAIDRAARRYHSRTLDGPAAGSDIVTHLTPVDGHATDVAVEFFVPDVPAGHTDAYRAFYTQMYTRLWDEDEAMMVARQQVLDAARPAAAAHRIALGPLGALTGRLPLRVDTPAGPVRLTLHDGIVRADPARCPHLGGPLEHDPATGCLVCPWHGYRFDAEQHVSTDGRGLRAAPGATVDMLPDGSVWLVTRG